MPPAAFKADFAELKVENNQIVQLAQSQRGSQAVALAQSSAVSALGDLAALEFLLGRVESAVKRLRDALDILPDSQHAFHNLVTILLANKQLRGPNLQAIREAVAERRGRAAWLAPYERLMYLPHFLNLEFVLGKCNLKCRMCVGINDPSHPDKLSYITPEDFRAVLAAAPSISGVTLSSGDSDPLLHPRFDQIIDASRDAGIKLDLFTNGHALGPRLARQMIESGVFNMLNVSLDAATPQTYARIRGSDFGRVLRNVEMLQELKRELGQSMPWVSLGLVAMADNIEELPDFVSLAARLGAKRVFAGDLIGWLEDRGGNVPATENPRWREAVVEARRRAEAARIYLLLPEQLRFAEAGSAPRESSSAAAGAGAIAEEVLPHCGWLGGLYSQRDGTIEPCCMVQGVADMGNVRDGPLLENAKYTRVKSLLAEGKVFGRCTVQRGCQYVQQQLKTGSALRVISEADLGEHCRRRSVAEPAPPGTMPLPVLVEA